MRTLPYEMVMACKRELPKKILRSTASHLSVELERCALNKFADKYGPASGPVYDRLRVIAQRTAAATVSARNRKRRKSRR